MGEETIFAEALRLSTPEQRAAYLDQVCAGQPELRKSVESLLAAYDAEGKLLEEPPAELAATLQIAPVLERPGSVIGPYRLLELIGEGGMGVVYRAEQREPGRREVALKIIKPGMDTPEVIGRFEAERQALALMDHTNIAKVLDAGATETGRPYFVMELVRGVPITDFCDQHQLTLRERLDLFTTVCQAVQHAHQKGIIHRDIKPSNVLVSMHDVTPVVKIIDFGVAKAVNQRLTERTLFTKFSQMVGTPLYMSPEQAGMSDLDIDTRSDIYSLGVLLYELLTGTTPFDRHRLGEAAFDEIRRIIREEEPPKPSTRISTLGDASTSVGIHRKTDARKLSALVRGDLDWIVMKALEKDRTRRYETASEFASDVLRFLSDQPVEACPPSVLYRLRKFARRNRTALATMSLFAAILVSGAVIGTWLAIRATKAERRATRDAAIARAVKEFMNDDLFAQASPDLEPDRDLKLRTVLDRASQSIENRFPDQPLVEAAIRHTLGTTYLSLGEYETARRHLERAYQIRQRELGESDEDTLRTLYQRGQLHHFQGRYRPGKATLEEVLSAQRRRLGPRHADTLSTMNALTRQLLSLGMYPHAEELATTAWEMSQLELGEEHPTTLRATSGLATAKKFLGRFVEAEKHFTAILDVQQRNLGSEHPETLHTLSQLAELYRARGQIHEAEKRHREVLAARQRVLGAEHPQTLSTMDALGALLLRKSAVLEAVELFVTTLDTRRRTLGPDHPDTLASMSRLAGIYHHFYKHREAVDMFRQALESQRRILGDEHPLTLATMSQLGEAQYRQCRVQVAPESPAWGEAVELVERALVAQRRALGDAHPDTIAGMERLAKLHNFESGRSDKRDLRKLADVEALYREVFDIRYHVLGENHSLTISSMKKLAQAMVNARLFRNEDVNEARDVWQRAVEFQKAVLRRRRQKSGPHHPDTLKAMYSLARSYMGWGPDDMMVIQKPIAEATALVAEAAEGQSRVLGPAHPDTVNSIGVLAGMFHDTHKRPHQGPEDAKRVWSDAQEAMHAALEQRRQTLGSDHADTLELMQRVAEAHASCWFFFHDTSADYAVQQNEHARRLQAEVLAIRRRTLGSEDPLTIRNMRELAVYAKRGKRHSEARDLCRQALEIQRRRLGDSHPVTVSAALTLVSCSNEHGQVLYAEEKIDEAIAAYREAYEVWSDWWGGDYQFNLATALVVSKDATPEEVSEAIALAEGRVKKQPNDTNYWTTLGIARYRAGRWQEALDALSHAFPDESQAAFATRSLFLAMCHWQLGRQDSARRWYERAIERMERVALSQVTPTTMGWELRRFRSEAENLLGPEELANARDAKERRQRASQHIDKKDWDKAIEEYTAASELWPDYIESWRSLARAYRAVGNRRGFQGIRRQVARQLADAEHEAVSYVPPLTWLAWTLVNMLHDEDQLEASLKSDAQLINDLEEHIRSAPSEQVKTALAAAYRIRAKVLQNLNRHQEAIADCAHAVDILQDNDVINVFHWQYHAVACLLADDRDSYETVCQEMLQRFAETAKTNNRIRNAVVETCTILPPRAKVADCLVKITEKLPSNGKPVYQSIYARALLRANRPREAAEIFSKSIPHWEREGADLRTCRGDWFLAAMACHRLGQSEKALQYYQDGLDWTSRHLEYVADNALPISPHVPLRWQIFRQDAASLLGLDEQEEGIDTGVGKGRDLADPAAADDST